MNPPTAVTIFSGIVLLAVLAVVGWNLRRSRRREPEDPGSQERR